MVIPWDGYSLSELINFCEPLPSAKYVQFLSLYDKKQMPDAPYGYDWPYSEGLRMDEAMNPLALLTFGCYGNVLPNQNGSPIRVVLPWKYGFKSAKSIVKIKLRRQAAQDHLEPAKLQTNTASTRTSTQTSTIPAGLRPTSAASTPALSPKPSPPSCSTATPTRSPASTTAWTSESITKDSSHSRKSINHLMCSYE